MSAINNKARKSKLIKQDGSLKEMKIEKYDNASLDVKSEIKGNDNNRWFADAQIIVHNVKKEVISVEEVEDEEEIDGYKDIYIKKEIKEEPTDQEFYERIISSAVNKYKEITKTDNELANFKCSNCAKLFDSLTEFQSHLECLHEDESLTVVLEEIDCVYFLVAKPSELDIYSCTCNLIFHSKECYDIHTMKCRKCFQCDICRRSYPDKVSYDMHFLIYHRVSNSYAMPVKLNKCKLCNNSYVGGDALHRCPKRKIFGFSCQFCKKEFNTASFLDLHLNAMAKINYKCDECDLSLERQCQLPHNCFQRDNFECTLCFKVFLTEAKLQEHVLVTHIVNEVCQGTVPPKKKAKSKNSNVNISSTTHYLNISESEEAQRKQTQSDVYDTSEFQVKQEELDISENRLQQKQLSQDNYNEQRYNNLMKTLIKDEPIDEVDVEMHLNNHIIAVASDNIKEEIESTKECDTVRKVNENKLINRTTRSNQNEYIRIYKCAKCKFDGTHKEHTEHKRVCKPRKKKGNIFYQIIKCNKCKVTFERTYDFVCHYVRKGCAPLQCFDCDELLDNRITYEMHVYSHLFSTTNNQNRVTLKCNLCNCSLKKFDYYNHWVKHIDLDNVQCETVDDLIRIIKERRSERLMATPEKLTEDEINAMLDMLSTPKVQLLKEKRKSCCYCNKIFSRIDNAKIHIIEHLLTDAYLMKQHNKELACQFCFESFKTQDLYKLHMRAHGLMKLYQCNLCSKTFSDSSNFSKHKKVHNILVLICDLCSKKFTNKTTLIRHYSTEHDGNNRFSCCYCSKEYTCLSYYKNHVRMSHLDIPKYMCRQCKQRFKCLKDKWNHMWEEHGERTVEADCPECGDKFRTYQALKRHILNKHDDWSDDERKKYLLTVKASKRKVSGLKT